MKKAMYGVKEPLQNYFLSLPFGSSYFPHCASFMFFFHGAYADSIFYLLGAKDSSSFVQLFEEPLLLLQHFQRKLKESNPPNNEQEHAKKFAKIFIFNAMYSKNP